jgi:hypothetical protein
MISGPSVVHEGNKSISSAHLTLEQITRNGLQDHGIREDAKGITLALGQVRVKDMLRRIAILAFASLLLTTLATGATDAKLVNMLDPSTRVVAGLNATAIKADPFGKYLLSRAANADLSKFVASTGFDPRTNLQDMLFGSVGGANDKQGGMLVKGTFAPAQALAFAMKKGGTPGTYHDVKVAEFAAFQDKHGHSHGPRWLAFLSPARAAFGSPEFVQHAIDRYVNGTAADAGLASRIAAASGQFDAWYVSTVPGPEAALRLPQQSPNELVGLAATALQSVQSDSAGVKFGAAGASVKGQAVTASNQEALSLADRLRYMGSVAQTQATQKNKPTAASVIQKLSISTSGPDVNWTLQVPESQLEALAKAHAQAHHQSAQ